MPANCKQLGMAPLPQGGRVVSLFTHPVSSLLITIELLREAVFGVVSFLVSNSGLYVPPLIAISLGAWYTPRPLEPRVMGCPAAAPQVSTPTPTSSMPFWRARRPRRRSTRGALSRTG